MMKIYCDESDDGQTYSLAGWVAVPSAWDSFEPKWREMLNSIAMPDGTPCKSFHAADIVSRDEISDSPFKGWTFDDEKAAFIKATGLIEDKRLIANLWPVGVSLEMPSSFTWIPRDSIWLMLFTKLFFLLIDTYPAQRSIALMFDEKDAIKNNALTIYAAAKNQISKVEPDYLTTIGFGDDKDILPLQAADFLAYEWRKRISDGTHRPTKPVRKSYERIRAARNEGALWRYGRSLFDEAMLIDPIEGDQSMSYYRWFNERPPTHLD